MAYQSCKFCRGRGCLACEGERRKDAERPIEPAFIIREDHPEDWDLIKDVLHRDALVAEVEQGGDFQHRIEVKLALARLGQHLKAQADGTSQDLIKQYEDAAIHLHVDESEEVQS